MEISWFTVKDFFSPGAVKYLCGLFAFLIFSMSIMSFKNDDGAFSKNIEFTSTPTLTNTQHLKPVIFIPLNPQATLFTKNFLSNQSLEYKKMKNWGKPYFTLFDKILSANGLPLELKYLSVIESDLKGNLVSSADAVGPWQLMPDEAKKYHLATDEGNDERMDFGKSTEVACQLLKGLHNEFGDWLLAIAAYNCGEGRMRLAIKKSGTTDFWKLQYYLPEETRRHVKKYIATDYYFEGTSGFTTMSVSEIANFLSMPCQQTGNRDNLLFAIK